MSQRDDVPAKAGPLDSVPAEVEKEAQEAMSRLFDRGEPASVAAQAYAAVLAHHAVAARERHQAIAADLREAPCGTPGEAYVSTTPGNAWTGEAGSRVTLPAAEMVDIIAESARLRAEVERLTRELSEARSHLRTIDVELDHAEAPIGPEDGSGVYTADGRVIALGLICTRLTKRIEALRSVVAEARNGSDDGGVKLFLNEAIAADDKAAQL